MIKLWRKFILLLILLVITIGNILFLIIYPIVSKNNIMDKVTLSSEVKRIVSNHSYDSRYIGEIIISEHQDYFNNKYSNLSNVELVKENSSYIVKDGLIKNKFIKIDDSLNIFSGEKLDIDNSIIIANQINIFNEVDINIKDSIVIGINNKFYENLNFVDKSYALFKDISSEDEVINYNNSLIDFMGDNTSLYFLNKKRGEYINNSSFIDKI